MNEQLETIEAKLEKQLSKASLAHCLRTARAAADLAAVHNVDVRKAYSAGLMHDVAKDLSDGELVDAASIYEMLIDPVEAEKPYLLHAGVGARILADEYGVVDDDILEAVRNHTFGKRDMAKLDKIVFLADVIEPSRDFDGLGEIRKLAVDNVDRAFARAYQRQLIFIVGKGGYLHPRTIDVWNQIAREVRELG